jgi:hypothetical protein
VFFLRTDGAFSPHRIDANAPIPPHRQTCRAAAARNGDPQNAAHGLPPGDRLATERAMKSRFDIHQETTNRIVVDFLNL